MSCLKIVLGRELLEGAGHGFYVGNQAGFKLFVVIRTTGIELMASGSWIRARRCWFVSLVAGFELMCDVFSGHNRIPLLISWV